MEKTKEEIGAIVFETKKHSIHKAVDGNYYICINKITGQQIVYYDLDWLINYASELNDGFELPDGYIHETHNYVVYRDDDEDNYVCMNKKDGNKVTAPDSDFCISYAESKDAEFEKPKIEILYENYRTQVYRNPEGKIVTSKDALQHSDPNIIGDLREDLAELASNLRQQGIQPSTNQ